MVRPEVFQKRIEKIGEYLAILSKIREYPEPIFLADPEKYGSAERFLQLVIEALNDLGSHVVSDFNLGVVEVTRDIPRLLCHHGYLSELLRDIWIRMIGFRYLLVHEYLDVDRRIVHEVLHRHLADLQAIVRIFAQFL